MGSCDEEPEVEFRKLGDKFLIIEHYHSDENLGIRITWLSIEEFQKYFPDKEYFPNDDINNVKELSLFFEPNNVKYESIFIHPSDFWNDIEDTLEEVLIDNIPPEKMNKKNIKNLLKLIQDVIKDEGSSQDVF